MFGTYPDQYDIEVELTLFTLEEGGRKTGIPSNSYGPHVYMDGYEWHAYFTLKDRGVLNPGETSHAFITFFFPALIKELHPGQLFLLHEGYRPIGRGRIIAILDFEKRAEAAHREEKNVKLLGKSETRIPPHWEKPLHKYNMRKKKRKEK